MGSNQTSVSHVALVLPNGATGGRVVAEREDPGMATIKAFEVVARHGDLVLNSESEDGEGDE